MKLPPPGYTLVRYDNEPVTHVMCDVNVPAGEMKAIRGYLFVPPALRPDLGPPDAKVHFGDVAFDAWRLVAPPEDTAGAVPALKR